VECSSPDSQLSARCHLGGMDLTRQRLVTLLRGEMCAAGSGGTGPEAGRLSKYYETALKCLQIK
jgi:hypothetical protein